MSSGFIRELIIARNKMTIAQMKKWSTSCGGGSEPSASGCATLVSLIYEPCNPADIGG
jgi:hypothetical protein